MPNEVYEVDEIPRTLTGKKTEVPVRKLLLGIPITGQIGPIDGDSQSAS